MCVCVCVCVRVCTCVYVFFVAFRIESTFDSRSVVKKPGMPGDSNHFHSECSVSSMPISTSNQKYVKR